MNDHDLRFRPGGLADSGTGGNEAGDDGDHAPNGEYKNDQHNQTDQTTFGGSRFLPGGLRVAFHMVVFDQHRGITVLTNAFGSACVEFDFAAAIRAVNGMDFHGKDPL